MNRFLTIASLLIISTTVMAEIRVFVPNDSHGEPAGLYMVADYYQYPEPVNIDFTSPQPGRDLVSVVTNYYYSLSIQDKDMFVDLYASEDGSKDKMEKWVDEAIFFQQKMEFQSVELLGVLNWGKLKAPLVKVESKPWTLGVGFLICHGEECHLSKPASSESFRGFFEGVRGRYAENWRVVSDDEMQRFKQNNKDFLHYSIKPTNPKHWSSKPGVQYPTVYLNLHEYKQKITLPLGSESSTSNTKIPPEIAPVIEWLNWLKASDRNQTDEDDRLRKLLAKEIDRQELDKRRQSMFRLEKGEYENNYVPLSRYATTVRRWSAVTPVGYLQHGDLKYVYFYPQTDFWPINEDTGESIIQIIPVRQIGQSYRIDLDAVPYTPKGPILFAEAIQLATQSLPIESRANLLEYASFDQGIDTWHVDDSASWAQFDGVAGSGALHMAAPYYSRPPFIHEKHAKRCIPIGEAIEFTVEAWFRYDSLPATDPGHRLYLYWHESGDCSREGAYDEFILPGVLEGWQKLEKSEIQSPLNAKALEIRLSQNQESSAKLPAHDPSWFDSIRELFGLQPRLETATAYWDNVKLIATSFQETQAPISISGSEFTLPPGQNYVKNGDFNDNADGWRLWKDIKIWVPNDGYQQTGALRSTLVSPQHPSAEGMFYKCIAFGDYRSYETSVRIRKDSNSTQEGDARLRAIWFENEDCTGRAGSSLQQVKSKPGFDWQKLELTGLVPVPGSRALRITLFQTISGTGEFSVYWDDVYIGASTNQ